MIVEMPKNNMIVSSDDEDTEEEIIVPQNMGLLQTKTKEKPLVCDGKENNCSDSDDVCVVGEVSSFKKYPRGAVIGSNRQYDGCSVHTSSMKRRRRPDGPHNGVKSITIRRTPGASSFQNLWNSSRVRRKLFLMEESIRLEERRSYVELIKKIVGVSLLFSAHFIRSHFSPLRNFDDHHLFTRNAPRALPAAKKHSLPTSVEYIDLTCDDSDSDVEEIPQASSSSKHDDIEEISTDSDDSVVVHLDENSSSSSTDTQDDDLECVPISSCKNREILSVEEDEDQYVSVEDKTEVEEVKEDKENSGLSLEHKSKRNLEDQLLHQMILEDEVVSNAETKDIDEDYLEESLPEITPEMQVLVLKAFTSKSNKVLVTAFDLELRVKDIHTLKGNTWLNDQVINFYMCLLMERGKLSSYPSVYCFNTFFFVKLSTSGHASLKRWTRQVDIFSYDLLIVPIHLKVHWCLACVNFIEKRIEYYDSMHGTNEECGWALFKYLEDEYLDKKREIFNISGWDIVTMKDIPVQMNGSDCGVFLCTYAEYICRLAKLTFSQRDMPYFRVKMTYEILTKKLLL